MGAAQDENLAGIAPGESPEYLVRNPPKVRGYFFQVTTFAT